MLTVSVCWLATLVVTVNSYRDENVIQLPEYMNTCSRNSEDINQCLKDTLQSLLPNFANGASEFDLKPLDPYYIDFTHFEYNKNNVKIKAVFKDIYCYGISAITVKDVRARVTDPSNFYLEVDVSYPRILLEVNYKSEGQFLAIPLNVKGFANVSMNDVSTTWKITGNNIFQNGKEHVQIKHFEMEPKVGNMSVWVSRITGNQEFDEKALQFINELWPLFYHQMLPSISAEWDREMTVEANKIFLKVPFSQLFPEN